MAQISKTDHPRILHLVQVERRKVVEVAAEYGCTTANIYALLAKMRRGRAEEVAPDGRTIGGMDAMPLAREYQHGPVEATRATAEVSDPSDLFAEASVEMTEPPARVNEALAEVRTPTAVVQVPATLEAKATAPAPSSGISDQLSMTLPPSPTNKPVSSLTLVKDMPRKGASADRSGTDGTLAKTGFGLAMRTADGDEAVTPFRSLDDLLSAIKPILRSAARSPDAVWFSIQPVDLATLEVDAA